MALEFDESSILSEDEVAALFTDSDTEQQDDGSTQAPPKTKSEDEQNNKENTAEEETTVDVEHLFDPNPESVGGNEDNQGKKENAPLSKSIPPPSSLAKALKEDGIFPNLEDSDIENVKDWEGFSTLVDKVVEARFDERQKRIDEALNNGVEPNVIQQYENTLQQLDSITEAHVTAETEQGENLRKNILMRDYLNKGFAQARAQREVERSFSAGTDVEDAKEALESIKQTMRAQYQGVLDEARAQEEEVKKARQQEASELRKGLLEGKEVFGDLEVDKAMRQKALDAIIKPVYQDPKTGDKFTAIQQYEREHRVDFLKKLGIVWAMTDGFKNLEGLVKGKVRKEVGKGMRALEETLNNTQRKNDGSLDFVSGANDSESFLGFTVDI